MVAASAGLDSSDYTVPYVANWAGGDVELLKGTASRVLTVSRGILDDAVQRAFELATDYAQGDDRLLQHAIMSMVRPAKVSSESGAERNFRVVAISQPQLDIPKLARVLMEIARLQSEDRASNVDHDHAAR